MPSFAEQSKRNLKAIKEGGSRPFFIACDGRRTEIFVAKNGTVSQFKDVKKINAFIGKNKLGENLSAAAKIAAGTIQRTGGTCYFDLAVKKGVSEAILKKTLGLTKRTFQIKTFELGKPAVSAPGGEAMSAPASGPELDSIRSELKKSQKRRANMAVALKQVGQKLDGSDVSSIESLTGCRDRLKVIRSIRKQLIKTDELLGSSIGRLKEINSPESQKLQAEVKAEQKEVKAFLKQIKTLRKSLSVRQLEIEVVAAVEGRSLQEEVLSNRQTVLSIEAAVKDINSGLQSKLQGGSKVSTMSLQGLAEIEQHLDEDEKDLTKKQSKLMRIKYRLQVAENLYGESNDIKSILEKIELIDMTLDTDLKQTIPNVRASIERRRAELGG